MFRSGVLGFIQNHKGVVQRPAPHKSQGGHFDHPFFQKPRSGLIVHHVVQSIVEGAEVRVHLFQKISGKESQSLPCFHGRAGQNDAVNLFLGQRSHPHGHGQIGLPRSRRPDTEHDVILANGIDIEFLG